MRQPKTARPASAVQAEGGSRIGRRSGSTNLSDNKPAHASKQVAVIGKSAYTQVRVTLKTWRGLHTVELREASATIPGIFFPTASGISIDINKIGELIAALEAAEAEARARGLMP